MSDPNDTDESAFLKADAAFPYADNIPPQPSRIEMQGGLTKRDYFAARAMAALCGGVHDRWSPEQVATKAYQMADAMIAESDKDEHPGP